MDLGQPLVEYGAVDISELREKMLELPASFWESDRASRVKVAGNRPGNAVFFYNDVPACVNRPAILEARASGSISVLRYKDRPLFPEIQSLIETRIKQAVPNCGPLRVQLASLAPGEIISPHKDMHILAMIHRLHIPLVTHKDVNFKIGGGSFFLEEGQLYDLNNTVVHSVENNSDVLRVHLLFDMLPNSIARTKYYDDEKSMIAACAKIGS